MVLPPRKHTDYYTEKARYFRKLILLKIPLVSNNLLILKLNNMFMRMIKANEFLVKFIAKFFLIPHFILDIGVVAVTIL